MKRRVRVPRPEELPALDGEQLAELMRKAQPEALRADRYLSWQELRFRTPPEGLTTEQWWMGIKLHRAQARVELPLGDARGVPFRYAVTAAMQQMLYQLDRAAGAPMLSEDDRYLLSSPAEESIMSSLLEGAAVTRSEARELIRSNRPARDEHEQMVMNNYRTMQMITEQRDRPLTPDFILALHRSMTTDTLRDPEKAGTLRRAEDRVCIEDTRTGDIIHRPPAAESLPARLEALCRFANGENGEACYLHPIIRAVILHFQLAYDHPFVDGNGRTARSLFYWGMLHAGYGLFEHISISREIYRHSRSYYEAFLNAEEDDNDLNYFILDQLRTIGQALDSLNAHLSEKQARQEALAHALDGFAPLNPRQRGVLLHFLRHPTATTSVTQHCREYGIVRQTARTDLTALERLGLVSSRLVSREYIFRPAENLVRRLREMGLTTG